MMTAPASAARLRGLARAGLAATLALALLMTAQLVPAQPAMAATTGGVVLTVLSGNGHPVIDATVSSDGTGGETPLHVLTRGEPLVLDGFVAGRPTSLEVSYDAGGERYVTTVSVVPTPERSAVTVTLDGMRTAFGTVTGIDPSLVAGVVCAGRPAEDGSGCDVVDDLRLVDGRFQLYHGSWSPTPYDYLAKPFYMELTVGSYTLFPAADGGMTSVPSESVALSTARPITLRAPSFGSVTGTVRFPSGAPADGVHVTLRSLDHDGTVALPTVDRTGRFTARLLAPGRYSFTANDSSTEIPAIIRVRGGVTATAPDATAPARLPKYGTATLVATIKDPEGWYATVGDTFVEGCGLYELRASDGTFGRHFASDVLPGCDKKPSSRTKRVKVTKLRAGRYTFHVAGTRITKKVVLTAGRTTNLGTITRPKAYPSATITARDTRGRAVRGRYFFVVDSAGGAAFVGVTGKNGRLKLPRLPAGTYTVASYDGIGIRSSSMTLVVKAPRKVGAGRIKAYPAKSLTFRAARSMRFTGVVRDPAGRPVRGARVGVVTHLSDASYYAAAVTDSKGRYNFEVSGMVGKVRIGARTRWPDSYATAYSDRITLKAGASWTVDLTLSHL